MIHRPAVQCSNLRRTSIHNRPFHAKCLLKGAELWLHGQFLSQWGIDNLVDSSSIPPTKRAAPDVERRALCLRTFTTSSAGAVWCAK
jgi:hypothetical protein